MGKEKPQAVFIVGFNNWGKTKIIYKLFAVNKFDKDVPTVLESVFDTKFIVQHESNDDFNADRWMREIGEKIEKHRDNHLISALCPTYNFKKKSKHEHRNNFIDLLKTKPFEHYTNLYLFLIENKYDHHAKLNIGEIVKAARQNVRMKIIVINADTGIVNVAIANQDIYNQRLEAQVSQIIAEMHKIF